MKIDNFRLYRITSDDEANAILSPTASNTSASRHAASRGIYSLTGQRISSTSASLPNLPAGLYIVNGQKISK